MPEPRTIHFLSLGCPKNRVDTEVMLGVSDERGFALVSEPENAEVIVVNTCGFIGPAKEESIDAILRMASFKEAGSCRKLVVAGCLSQRHPVELASEMPEVDHFLGSSDMLRLAEVLDRDDAARLLVGNPADWVQRATDPRRPSVSRHSAYLKIAEGCNRTCSFCIIPALRGMQRSRTIADLVAEAEQLVASGVVELNLVSQDTIAYGRDRDGDERLVDLVEALGELSGLRWIRLHYLYPETITEELVELLDAHPRVLPYVDMPLQHASDSMLRRMRRGHGGARLRKLVERLRAKVRGLVFRSAFIVGHPGESDDDFRELCDFVRWAEFDHVGVFRYSNEEGTVSAELDHPVPAKVAHARHRKLLATQRPIARAKNRARIGTELDVLIEGESDESDFVLEGRHGGQAPEIDGKVFLALGPDAAPAQRGQIRRALVTAAADYDLVAELRDAPSPADSALARGTESPRRSAVRTTRGVVRLRTVV